MSASAHGQLTAVPIAVQGNNVSIVPGNMNAQFIAKATPQAIRPAGAAGQIMVQVRDHVKILSKFAPKKIVPYDGFEQVILVFRPEWLVQSQHMERFFSERIWPKF